MIFSFILVCIKPYLSSIWFDIISNLLFTRGIKNASTSGLRYLLAISEIPADRYMFFSQQEKIREKDNFQT